MELVEKFKSHTTHFDEIEKEILQKYRNYKFYEFIYGSLGYYAENKKLKSYFSLFSYGLFEMFALNDTQAISNYLLLSNEKNLNFCLSSNQSFETFKLFIDNISRFNLEMWIIWVDGMLNIEKIKYACEKITLPERISRQLLFYAYSSCNREIFSYLKSKGYIFIKDKNDVNFQQFEISKRNKNFKRLNFLEEFEKN